MVGLGFRVKDRVERVAVFCLWYEEPRATKENARLLRDSFTNPLRTVYDMGYSLQPIYEHTNSKPSILDPMPLMDMGSH